MNVDDLADMAGRYRANVHTIQKPWGEAFSLEEIEAKVAEWAKPKRPFHHSKIAGAIFGGVIGIAFGIFLLLLKTFWGK